MGDKANCWPGWTIASLLRGGRLQDGRAYYGLMAGHAAHAHLGAPRPYSCPYNCPPLALNAQADGCRKRLRQIAVNLVGNACKYTTTGGHVDVLLRNGGDRLRVDVRDTGVGISEAARPHIFTPFYRADNPLRDVVGGTAWA
jgi:signal transduction histidine kinase